MMHPNVTPKPQYAAALKSWLKIATRGLCPDAEARARREITEHFCAAAEEQMARGATFDVAVEHAHRALGSPRAARRRLLHSDLSHYEARLIANMNGAPAYGVDPVISRRALQAVSCVAILGLVISQTADFGFYVVSGLSRDTAILLQLYHWTMYLSLIALNAPLFVPRPKIDADASVLPRLRRLLHIQASLGVGMAVLIAANAALYVEHVRSAQHFPPIGKPGASLLGQLLFACLYGLTLRNTLATMRKLAHKNGPVQS